MVIAALWRGAYRQFLLIFVYVIAEFLITVAEIPLYLARFFSGQADARTALSQLYWIDDVILEALLYGVVLALIYHATARMRSRRVVRVALTAGGLLFACISLLIHYKPNIQGDWMVVWTRDLSFCSMLLDLALWMALVSGRYRDWQLMLASGALGIRFAGSAIGDAIQELAAKAHYAHSDTLAVILSRSGAILTGLAGLACLYLWWRAFRPAPEKATPSGAALAGTRRREE
jgi:hypothetical protein